MKGVCAQGFHCLYHPTIIVRFMLCFVFYSLFSAELMSSTLLPSTCTTIMQWDLQGGNWVRRRAVSMLFDLPLWHHTPSIPSRRFSSLLSWFRPGDASMSIRFLPMSGIARHATVLMGGHSASTPCFSVSCHLLWK